MQTPNPVQTTYQRYLNVGQAGMPASATGWDVDTKICMTAAGIGFGLAVCQALGADRGVDLGSPSGTVIVGVSAADITKFVPSQAEADVYQLYDSMPVAVRGDWWVQVDNDVSPDIAVYFDATTGKLGHTGGTLINSARWMTTASAGGLAVVRLGHAAIGA